MHAELAPCCTFGTSATWHTVQFVTLHAAAVAGAGERVRVAAGTTAYRACVQLCPVDFFVDQTVAVIRRELRVDVTTLRLKLGLVLLEPLWGILKPAFRPPAISGTREHLLFELIFPLVSVHDKVVLDVGARVDEIVGGTEDCKLQRPA